MARRRVILVGIDGGYHGLRATDYAAGLAAEQGRPLRLVYAYHVDPGLDLGLPGYGLQEMRAYGAAALERAQQQAHEIAPDVSVDQFLVHARPALALVQASVSASLVVVGRPRRHQGEPALSGSTGAGVAGHAHCPVIVVPGGWRPDPNGRVVIGADGSSAGRDAVGFAFAEASRRRSSLIAVRIWEYPPRWRGTAPEQPDELIERLDAVRLGFAEDLAGWSEQYPDVHVTKVVENCRSAARALLDRSSGADLLVVGSRGHDRVADLGWTARSVLIHAEVPVAIVHRGDRAASEPELLVPVSRAR